jgi:hypothetical protein
MTERIEEQVTAAARRLSDIRDIIYDFGCVIVPDSPESFNFFTDLRNLIRRLDTDSVVSKAWDSISKADSVKLSVEAFRGRYVRILSYCLYFLGVKGGELRLTDIKALVSLAAEYCGYLSRWFGDISGGIVLNRLTGACPSSKGS